MPFYAQTNEAGFVTSVSETTGAIEGPNIIEISGLHESVLGKIYDAGASEAAGQPVFVDAPPVEPEWEWLLDLAPFSDRLGPAATAIDLATIPGLVAVRSDFSRRKWINLRDPRVIAAVRYLAGAAHPQLGTLQSPLITQELADWVLETKPEPSENLALRKLYFS